MSTNDDGRNERLSPDCYMHCKFILEFGIVDKLLRIDSDYAAVLQLNLRGSTNHSRNERLTSRYTVS